MDRRVREMIRCPTYQTHLTHPAYLTYLALSGSAKTYRALPVAGIFTSGMIVRGTWRGLPPPVPPVVTATYWRPPTLNVTGYPITVVPRRVCHSVSPVFTSNARNTRSRSPTKPIPLSVVTTA